MSKLAVRMAEKYAGGEGITNDILRRVIIEVLTDALGEAKEQCAKECDAEFRGHQLDGCDCSGAGDCADRIRGMEFE